ncbi:LysE family translocator [Ollibium composti]|uniref:LysE family translocator n=1 Tax=Ollibium composti TaxID=2675109 RepID=A0ABY2Q754_9HYPH|nr:LysE family translocator [Mesorhizobium composti]THF56078.1 LysE family translocator [Mesorhizobium composti]
MYAAALWLYFVLLVGIIVVPGMDMFFVLANALTGGRQAGLAATAGIMLGGICHTLFGTVFVVGLSNVVPVLSKAMLVVGSLYMAWIGISLLRSTIEVRSVGTAARRPPAGIFLQGLLTCILNPKAWLFVLAVFPQFMKPEYGPIGLQALVMGTMTVTVQLAVYGGLALAAGQSREALTGHPAATVLLGRGAGALLVSAAGFALWEALQAA